GRPAHVYNCARDVVLPPRPGAGRTASPALGVADGGQHRRGFAAEGSDRGGVSHRGRVGLPGGVAAIVPAPDVAALAAIFWRANRLADRRPLACSGDASQSAVSLLFDA